RRRCFEARTGHRPPGETRDTYAEQSEGDRRREPHHAKRLKRRTEERPPRCVLREHAAVFPEDPEVLECGHAGRNGGVRPSFGENGRLERVAPLVCAVARTSEHVDADQTREKSREPKEPGVVSGVGETRRLPVHVHLSRCRRRRMETEKQSDGDEM